VKDQNLKILCEDLLKKPIESITPVNGGDINHAYQLETKDKIYFCKTNNSEIGEDLLLKEEDSLKVLSRYCRVPEKIASAPKVLILSWVNSSNKSNRFWENLAEGLADIHKIGSNKFGYDKDNHIGLLPQSNTFEDTWSVFYVTQRLEPQLKMAIDKGLLSIQDTSSTDLMEKIISTVCPPESASLIHGDLWSGNILCDEEGKAYFIDPCVSYSHREMDIAMSMKFGKFDSCFYKRYQELRPLYPKFDDRVDMYQLYYLLAHLNMFGVGYQNDVLKIMKRYF